MDAVIPDEPDPVFVYMAGDKISLRIGGHGRGEGRISILTPKAARILAYALLRAAESAPEPGSQD